MPALLMLEVDAGVAAHLALALRLLRAECRRNYWKEPAPLGALLQALERLIEAQEGSSLATLDELADSARVTKLLLSLADTATALGVSLSTTKRLVRDGELPTVEVAGRRLVRRTDLERYVNRLRPSMDAIEHKAAAPAAGSASRRGVAGAGAGARRRRPGPGPSPGAA